MKERIYVSQLKEKIGEEASISGWLHKFRDLGKIGFIVIRDKTGIVQCVTESEEILESMRKLNIESVLKVSGKVVETPKKDDVEILISNIDVISPATELIPLEINKENIEANIDTIFDNKTVALKNVKQRSIFSLQAKVTKYVHEYFDGLGFTEIHTPKLIGFPTEGGSEIFEVKYYDRKAYLAQSPQFYKQMMVSVFEKVYEIAHAYRAENSNTTRHMSELVMIDAEIGFIESWRDLLGISGGMLRSIVDKVWDQDQEIVKLWKGIEKPVIPMEIPEVTVKELHEIVLKETGEDFTKEPDPSPIEERFICEYIRKNKGSDAVFITEFPAYDAKFYHYVNRENPEVADRADLIFKGVEVSTISRRINDYNELIDSAKKKGLDPENPGLVDYLNTFKYGMPPEGGFAFGLERITQKLLDLTNVKEASLFPRDVQRLNP